MISHAESDSLKAKWVRVFANKKPKNKKKTERKNLQLKRQKKRNTRKQQPNESRKTSQQTDLHGNKIDECDKEMEGIHMRRKENK